MALLTFSFGMCRHIAIALQRGMNNTSLIRRHRIKGQRFTALFYAARSISGKASQLIFLLSSACRRLSGG